MLLSSRRGDDFLTLVAFLALLLLHVLDGAVVLQQLLLPLLVLEPGLILPPLALFQVVAGRGCYSYSRLVRRCQQDLRFRQSQIFGHRHIHLRILFLDFKDFYSLRTIL